LTVRAFLNPASSTQLLISLKLRVAFSRVSNHLRPRSLAHAATRRAKALANPNRLLPIADQLCAVTNSPSEKPLRTTSFVIHATRGVIRDQNMRRKTMFVLLVVALVLLFAGSTFLQSALSPRQHPIWLILYWFVCAWLTLTAMLLAFFDILVVRAQARKAKRMSRGELSETSPDSPRSTIDQ
jgi:hypothetical protein